MTCINTTEIKIVDLRDTCPAFPIPRVRVRKRDGSTRLERWARARPRNPARVDAVCFHILDTTVGASKRLVARHGGDVRAARQWRFVNERHLRTYHWLSDHRERELIRKLSADVHGHHGDELNGRTIGHAYEAKRGGPFDWDFAAAAIVLMVEAERADGVDIQIGYAHAQSNGMRGEDPSEEYWQHAVIPAARYLKLELRPLEVFGDGKPLRDSWMRGWP